jgi:hypothetical protein
MERGQTESAHLPDLQRGRLGNENPSQGSASSASANAEKEEGEERGERKSTRKESEGEEEFRDQHEVARVKGLELGQFEKLFRLMSEGHRSIDPISTRDFTVDERDELGAMPPLPESHLSQRLGASRQFRGPLSSGAGSSLTGQNFNVALEVTQCRNIEGSKGPMRQEFSSRLDILQQTARGEKQSGANDKDDDNYGRGWECSRGSNLSATPKPLQSVVITTSFEPPRWSGPMNNVTVTKWCKLTRQALQGQSIGVDENGNNIPFTLNMLTMMDEESKLSLQRTFGTKGNGENAFEFLRNEDGSTRLDGHGQALHDNRFWSTMAASRCYEFLNLAEETFRQKLTDGSGEPAKMQDEIFHGNEVTLGDLVKFRWQEFDRQWEKQLFRRSRAVLRGGATVQVDEGEE